MRLMKFRCKDGGKFMGIEGDMLVAEVTRYDNGMVEVRIADERSWFLGDIFTAYSSELTPMDTCPMTQEHGHV